MKKLLLMMLAICALASCDKEKDEPKNIEVTGGSVKQELFADNTQGKEGVKFTTTDDGVKITGNYAGKIQ